MKSAWRTLLRREYLAWAAPGGAVLHGLPGALTAGCPVAVSALGAGTAPLVTAPAAPVAPEAAAAAAAAVTAAPPAVVTPRTAPGPGKPACPGPGEDPGPAEDPGSGDASGSGEDPGPAAGPSPADGPAGDPDRGRAPRPRPAWGWPARAWRVRPGNLEEQAAEFIRLHRAECPGAGPAGPRLREIRREIRMTGTYRHTPGELEFGARVAWRNSSRCIGRLYWKSLQVRDRREVDTAEGVAAECADHLRAATNHGRVRPTITVFAPDAPGRPGPRIWNEQLVRYAGYRQPDGTVRGEPSSADLTHLALDLGWPSDGQGKFDVLPLIISAGGDEPRFFRVPGDAVTEVHLIHPRFPWFGQLGLRWYAVPVISDMCLEIGGICYPAAPFNGWYMGTEIGARNFADADRYNELPRIAEWMGLDTSRDRSLWRDQALVELNLAVLHSYDTAGVTITDHHTESHRFLTHLAREERAGRICPADWTWIVPPMSGAATGVFHRYYEDAKLRPTYARHQRDLPQLRITTSAETCS